MILRIQTRIIATALLIGIFGLSPIVNGQQKPAENIDPKFSYPTEAQVKDLPGHGELRRYPGLIRNWGIRRTKWSAQVKADQGKVVFLGDSITQGWGESFRDQFPGMKIANRGIGGDTTRGMLIRLQEDVISLNPSTLVFLMGTNDIETGISPEDTAKNFGEILTQIKKHNPDLPVVLCRMFPSSASKNRPTETIQQVNALYEAIVRGDSQVTVLDTFALFDDGNGDADPAFFPDLLHLNNAGYEKWATALRPVFATLGFSETEADDFQIEEGFRSLFNGKDLTGWGFRTTPPRRKPKKPNPKAPVWVEITEPISFDGKTKSNDDRYQAINGRLVVTTPAEGRRIQQLWTTEEFPNDFTLKLEFRATPNADSGVFIRKPQLQCRDYILAGPYNDLKNYRPQDWNKMVVIVKGTSVNATCNGEKLEWDVELPETGPIGLEGDRGQIEYRRIRIKTE